MKITKDAKRNDKIWMTIPTWIILDYPVIEINGRVILTTGGAYKITGNTQDDIAVRRMGGTNER